MSEKLIVSWDDYNNTVEKLAVQIYDSGYKPTLLVGIMRGGAPMIDVLSRVFKLKCAYLAVESYSGKGVEDEQGEIVFSREMSSIAKNMGGNILLCDDLSDTGITLNKSVDWLKEYEKHLYFLKDQGGKISVLANFEFEYFNSSSAKYLMDIIIS